MRFWRALPTLAFVCTLGLSSPSTANDAGVAAPTVTSPTPSTADIPPPPSDEPIDAGGVPADAAASSPSSGSSSGTAEPPSTESLLKAAYKGITTKNWFLLAGALLALLAYPVHYLLEKKWSVFGNDKVKWVVTGLMAGAGALAHAWLADAPVASDQTLMGALKVFAAAVFAYVSAKKLAAAPSLPT